MKTNERVYRNKKWERPFSSSNALHITLRTKIGGLRSKPILQWLKTFIPAKGAYFGIRIYHWAILNGHLHLLLQARDKTALSGFLRVISGVIARRILGAEKGNPKGTKLWESRPYSRVLTWGREFKNVLAYIERNALEGAQQITYVARELQLLAPLKRRIAENLVLSDFERLSRQGELQL